MGPAYLISSLNVVRRKVRLLAIVSGLGIVVMAAIALLAGIVLIDWTLALGKFPRVLLLVLASAAFLHVFWHWLIRPAFARLKISDVAGRLEHAFPQFDDRLRSTINFSQSEIPGSDAMKQRVIDEASAMATHVNLQSVIHRGPVYAATSAGFMSAVVLGTIIFCGIFFTGLGNFLRTAGNRLLLGNDQWPKSVEISTDFTYNVTPTTTISLNGSAAKLSDLSAGTIAQVALAPDGTTALNIVAQTNNLQRPSLPGAINGAIVAVNSSAGTVTVRNELPTHVAVGDIVPVKIRLARGDKSSRTVYINYRFDNGQWKQAEMKRGDDNTYNATLDTKVNLDATHPSSNLQVRIDAADDQKPLPAISIVPPLQVVRAELEIAPPPYLQSTAVPAVNLADGKAVAVYGSSLGLRITCNKALRNARTQPVSAAMVSPKAGYERPAASIVLARFGAQAIMSAIPAPTPSGNTTFRFKLFATDTDGLSNTGGEEFEYTIREDQLPGVELTQPREWSKEERTPTAGFDIKALAHDDFGIAGAELVVERTRRESSDGSPTTQPAALGKPWVIPLLTTPAGAPLVAPGASFEPGESTPDQKSFNIGYHWELAELPGADLKKGDVLEYYVRVKDNFILDDPSNPSLPKKEHGWVSSGKATITIISMDDFMKRMEIRAAQIQAQIKPLASGERRQNEETKTLKEGIEHQRKFDDADLQQTTRLANDQAQTQSQTTEQAENLKEMLKEMMENKAPEGGLKKSATEVEAELRHTANNAMREARKNLDAAKDPTDAKSATEPKDSGEPKAPTDAKSANEAKAKSDPKTSAQAKNKNDPKNSADPKSGDQKASADPKSGDPKSGDQKASADPKSGDPKSGDQNASADPKSGDPKSGDQKASADPKTGAEPPKNADPKAASDPKSKEIQQRAIAMAKAADKQQEAANELTKSMNKLGQMDGLQGAIDALKQIRDEQQQVEDKFREDNKQNAGKKADELSKEDQKKNQESVDKQNELAQKTDKALEQMEKAADKMSKSDPAAESMKQAAKMGKQKALSQQQQDAAKDMQQNQQANAQKNQHNVELGLDQIINKLKEAQKKQLEELARQLAQLQQLVNNLVQSQAGHNIDNLLIQGGLDKLKQMDGKERDELFAWAGRELKEIAPDAKPQLSDLTTAQEVTYTNTLNIAKQAESLPEGTASGKLTQAAGHMERALVHLKNNKAVDAYRPPQVDALAALLEAKKLVDEAAKKAQEESNEKDADTIKEEYIKLLAEQKKVGAKILEIEAATKANNGELPRDQSVKLAQLPGKQGELIETARKIGEQLKELDSVVYDWANKDIISSMGRVKDNLAKPETGQPTQIVEKHTEQQLQDMIDSLIEKVRKSEFASRNNGGGGGGGGQKKPKMPGEVELRLLKKNQENINDQTLEQANKKEKDKEELLALGERQHDVRSIFDKLLQKNGNDKLGPPPPSDDELPENAKKEDLDNKEMLDNLLNDKPAEQKKVDEGVKTAGDHMYRSGSRLKRGDPGAITQEIQKRIVLDLDNFIKMAQKQQSNSKPKPGSGKPEQMAKAKPGPGQPQPGEPKPGKAQPKPGSQTPAQDSSLTQGGTPQVDKNADIKAGMLEWGRLTDRQRQAVQEAGSEEIIGKYQRLVDEYYKSLAEQAKK